MLKFLLKSALAVGAAGLILEGLKTLEEKDKEKSDKSVDIPDNMPITPLVRPNQVKKDKPVEVSESDEKMNGESPRHEKEDQSV